MKFRLIAEPNMDVFASDIRLRTFIREVTELTVSIVTKQCTEEIAVLVAKPRRQSDFFDGSPYQAYRGDDY
jgi:hypothetical protein